MDDAFGHDLFRFLLENTPDQVYFKDTDGRFLCVSRAVAEFMGARDPEDLIGKTDFDFWSEETARGTAEDEKRIVATGTPLIGKVERLVYPNGRVTWDYTSKWPLRNAGGEVIGICGINKDFTAVKLLEDALEAERDQLRKTTTELEAKNAQLEADLRMAREVQLALLPREYPCLLGYGISGHPPFSFAHYYRPTVAVGGDFFDVFPLSPARAGVFICDVMGHGLRAALVTAIIRALLEELRPLMLNAGRFLSALNLRLRAILERVDEPFVATAFYMILDATTAEVQFANAAHPVPVRIRGSTGLAESITEDKAKAGPGLGLFDDLSYATFSCPFQPSDTIVLFTDGLYEIESPDGKDFGRDALIATLQRSWTLPAEQLFAATIAEVCRFTARQDFDDDVCIVAVTRAMP